MLSTELQTFLPLEVSDADTNGGRMSSSQVISGVIQNVWDHVPKAERLSGSRKYRKLFDKVSNDDDEELMSPAYYVDGDTLGEDWVLFFPEGQETTQVDWVTNNPPTRKYVSGVLKTAIAPADTALTIVFKDNEQALHVLDADVVLIVDKITPDSGTGNEAQRTIVGAPVVSDKEVTITLTAAVGFDFLATSTKICVLYMPGVNIKCESSNWAVATAGDGDAVEDNLVMDNIGTIQQNWVLTRTTATAFTCVGDVVGALATGDSASEYAPSNPDWSKPYFKIPPSVWSGTWAIGDTLSFTTSPAAQPLVQERRVPVNCPSLANNRIRKVTTGESPT